MVWRWMSSGGWGGDGGVEMEWKNLWGVAGVGMEGWWVVSHNRKRLVLGYG